MSINRPISCNVGENQITLVFQGHAPYTLRRNQHNEQESKRFDEIRAKVISALENSNNVDWEEIRAMFIPNINVNDIVQDEQKMNFKSGRLVCENGRFYYRGYELKNYLVKRIKEIKLEADRSGQDMKHMLKPMLHFLDNLMDNPSKNSIAQLYRFVEHTKMPITEDGCLLAYKIVRDNYKDKHSNSYDNSPGASVEMPRNQVVDDPHQTCSSGLHFCSYHYATGFFNNMNKDRMMVIKINPADVVSIPVDYNNEKGRCCKYEVLYEIPMDELKREDVLGIYDDEQDFNDEVEFMNDFEVDLDDWEENDDEEDYPFH